MLVSILAQFQEDAEHEADRHAAWSAAIQQIRDDFTEEAHPGIPQLRDYLEHLPEDQRSEVLQDLVAEHLRLAWQTGKGPTLEEYLKEFAADFSEIASPSNVPASLVEDEFLARYQSPHGDTPGTAEYAQRFPNRPDVAALLEGRILDKGRGVRLHRLGQGAMGEVWEVYDLESHRSVAIKEPRADSTNKEKTLLQFASETSVTSGLQHPGVIALREDPRPESGSPSYRMRLVNGVDLGDRIGDYHQPSSDRTPRDQINLRNDLLRSFAAACDVISSAHDAGVIHRDLKPGNIIMETSGDTAILDWGMAKHISSEENPPAVATPGLIAGTPDYMSPEQADGFSDTRSDVFGLGATLYEILTGRPPHNFTNTPAQEDWAPLVRKGNFPSPRSMISGLPKALEAICLKALAREPGDRYQGASELSEDVRFFISGKPVSALPDSIFRKIARLLSRRSKR